MLLETEKSILKKCFTLSNKYFSWFCIFIIGVIFLLNLKTPLFGVQLNRQADTLMTAVLYCQENAPFMEPRLAFREDLAKGIAYGEFPIFSWIASSYCKLTTSWSEVFPKLLVFLFFGVGLALFIKSLSKEKFSAKSFLLISFSLSSIINNLPVPMPDAFVFFLFAISFYLSANKAARVNYLTDAVILGLITLGFVTRPYFVFFLPYLFWITKDRVFLLSLIPCSIAYYLWFKLIVPTGEITDYYATVLRPLPTMIKDLAKAPAENIYIILRDQFSIFGVILFINGFKYARIISLYGLCVVLVVYFILGGSSLSIHSYYILAASFIFIHVMAIGFEKLSPNKAYLLLNFMMLSMIATNQHHWQPSKVDQLAVRKYSEKNTKTFDRICTAHLGVSTGLYMALRTGWTDMPIPILSTTEEKAYRQQTCPDGVFEIDGRDFFRK